MTLVAQLTDLHPCATDEAGEARVRAPIAAVRARDPAPDCVIVTGDVTGTGERRDAWRAAEPLAPIGAPVHVLTLSAMRPPPLAVGNFAIDAVMLDGDDGRALAAVPARHPQVPVLARGHVHRAATTRLAGVRVCTAPIAWRRPELDFAAGARTAEIRLSSEPPGFALHRFAEGALSSHAVVAG